MFSNTEYYSKPLLILCVPTMLLLSKQNKKRTNKYIHCVGVGNKQGV